MLRRTFAGIFLQSVLPSILLSTVVFATNLYYQQRFDGAVAVNVTCLLAMSSFFIAIFQSLPKIPGMKIMDWFQIKCISLATLTTLFQTFDVYLDMIQVKNSDSFFALLKKILKTSIFWIIPIIGIGIDIIFITIGILYNMKLVSLF